MNYPGFRKSADAIIIGGGVIGLSVARELAKRNLSVIVVERGQPGAESSQAAAGMLAPQSEADTPDEFFRLACASRDAFPQFAETLREETGIDVELDRTGTLYLALTEADEQELRARFKWQKAAGLPVEIYTSAEARKIEPNLSPFARLALRFPLDWQVENRRLISALVASVEKLGVRLIRETEVISLIIERGRVHGVETSQGRVNAHSVVAANGAWTSLLPVVSASNTQSSPNLHPRIEAVRGQMVCLETRAAFVRHVVYSPRAYLVPRRDGRLLVGATVERVGFDCSVTASGIQFLLARGMEIAPRVGDLQFKDAWAGLRPRATFDGWPVIGESSEVENFYYATGHYRNGILLAPITGSLLADAITRESVPDMMRPFAPARFHSMPDLQSKIN
jgi:glycine oxidase